MKYNDNKISELLGILNSINYDEVINDLEIQSLRKWINENYKNDNTIIFQNIIKKLNRIFETNIITKDEKKDIIKITKQYNKYLSLKKWINENYKNNNKIFQNIIEKLNKIFETNIISKDEKEYNIKSSKKYNKYLLEKLSELVGIVEGIIADDVVNLKEFEKFKNWLNDTSVLKEKFLYKRLISLINNIFNDGELTEDEHRQLKQLLESSLKEYDLQQKIDIIKNKVINHEFIGNQLIELVNYNEIMNEIHKEAMEQIQILLKQECSVYAIDAEIVFLSLALIALLNYDGNYYNYVEETYEPLYKKYNEQKIEGQIRNIINKYRNESDSEHRIISFVLKNTIVPKKFLPDFFDFVSDIYEKNFNYNLDKKYNLNEEFTFIYDGIKKDLNLNYKNDILNLEATNKSYRLIKSTKDLIMDDKGINSLIELSISVLKIIDSSYWSNSNFDIENEYYKYGFENWKTKTEQSVKENKNKIIEFRSKWEPIYKLKDNKIYISIPNHKIKNNYNYEDLKIRVYKDNEIIYENDRPDIYDIIGGYKIKNKDILIENPLGNIRYKLVCKEDIVYDSEEKLFRNYIVFNDSGEELKNSKDYEGVVILCSKDKIENMNIIYNSEEYYLESKNVKIGDYIKINDEIFNFTTIKKSGIVGKEHNGKVIFNSTERIIYSKVEGIVYESIKNADAITIIVNNQRHRLSDFNFEVKKRGKIYNNYFIKTELPDQEYNIRIEEQDEGKYITKEKFNLIVDSSFSYDIEQMTDKNFLVKINYLKKEYSQIITYEIDDINRINIEELEKEFIIPLNIQLYKVDNNRWNNLNDLNNYIWIKDITTYSNLRINGLSFDIVKIKDKQETVLSEIVPTIKDYYLDLSIGTIKSYESHDYFYLEFYKDGNKTGMIKVYCKSFINNDATKFWYDKDDKMYHGIVSYFGQGNILLRVNDAKNDLIFEKKVESGDNVKIDLIKSFQNYKLTIIDKVIGFSLDKDKILYEKNIKYYSMNDFVGRYFQIDTVEYNQTINGIWKRKERYLYNTYIEITKQIDNYMFIGNLYVYKGQKKYFDKLNPVEIEFISDVDSKGEVQALITKDRDGLFNDFENKTILNEIDSRTAIDIYLYVIRMERKK